MQRGSDDVTSPAADPVTDAQAGKAIEGSTGSHPSRLRRVWIVAGTSGAAPGGMKRHVELHARGLEQMGIASRVLFTEEAWSRPKGLAARLPGAFLLASQLARLRAERPDVVNVHTLSAPAWILARQAGLIDAKVIVMSYGSDERLLPPSYGLRSRLARWRISVPARALFPRASGIWCVNSQDAAYYEHEYRIPRSRIAVLPHAIEDRFFVPASVERDWKRLLFVGTPIHRKGFDVLLAALSIVLARRPDATAVLAGTLSDCAEPLRTVPAAARSKIRVFPVLDDDGLRRLYQSSGLMLLPSRSEGLPFSLLEAMASGCPALAAANSGMLDVIEDGVIGWLQADFEPASWASRIDDLLDGNERLRHASIAARGRALRFRLAEITPQVVEWYDNLP